MPPKNKGTGKKPAKAQTPTLIDGLTKDELSKEQMKEHIVRLREELDRVREEKNYFKLERDKMQTFKDVTDRHLEETKAKLKKLNTDIENNEIRHKVEIEVYKQKMKHLLCEHQNTICELEADAVTSAELMTKEQDKVEAKLLQVLKNFSIQMEEHVPEASIDRHVSDVFDERVEPFRVKCKDLTWLEDAQHLLTVQQKDQLTELEERWDTHYSDLKDNLSQAFTDADTVTSYLQEATDTNATLRKKVEDGTEELKRTKEIHASLKKDIERLVKLFNEAKAKKAKIDSRLNHPVKMFAADTSLKKQIIAQKAENETLTWNLGKLQLETDELRDSITQSFTQMQHKADVRTAESEEKLKALRECVEQTDAQLQSVLSASNLDQTALTGIMKACKEKVDKDLQEKKAHIALAGESLLLNLTR